MTKMLELYYIKRNPQLRGGTVGRFVLKPPQRAETARPTYGQVQHETEALLLNFQTKVGLAYG